MITDSQTNFLYLSDQLEKYRAFSADLVKILTKQGIKHGFLPLTKDIWAVDYMPIQVNQDRFVRFTYQPDYLDYKKYESKKTDADEV
jgi:agmatine deiminase